MTLRWRLRDRGRVTPRAPIASLGSNRRGHGGVRRRLHGVRERRRGLRAIGYVEPDPIPPGPIALVSCSGSAFSAMLRTRRRFGWTVAISSGQELVTSAASYVDYASGCQRRRSWL